MVEVGGSNPPGPTKIKDPPLGGFFGFGGVGLDESRCSTNATNGAFGPPQRSAGARRVQSPEAMAIEDNPPGSTKFLRRDLRPRHPIFFTTKKIHIPKGLK
jgi:hypothetical protein